MYVVMNDSAIPSDVGITIEFNIPQTSKRIDFMISGYDAGQRSNVMIIELKQWEKLSAIDSEDALVETIINRGMRRVVHPS